MKVRTLREDEAMPQHLGTGFEAMPVMKAFCWVAEEPEKIIGMLMAAPCHGLIFFVRLRILKGSPAITAHLLFRTALNDCKKRGFKGYFTYIDEASAIERSFIPICERAGGFRVSATQIGLVGSIEQAARF